MLTKVPFYLLGAATEVETLKKALAEAKEKAAKEKAACEKHEARLSEVQQELKEVVTKNEVLEEKNKEKSIKLTLVTSALQEVRKEAHNHRKEIHQIKQIADGKTYLLKCIFGAKRFALLTRVSYSLGTF